MNLRFSMGTMVNSIFTIVFICHILWIGYDLKYPTNPHVKIYAENLRNIQFPLLIKFCVREKENMADRYKRVGYEAGVNILPQNRIIMK